MELEHEIMKYVVRIASGGRRRHHPAPNADKPRFCGYGHILDVLSKNDGLRQREIAEMLNISESNVKARLKRGRDKLRSILEK